jgi:hypothetical protein
MGDHGAMASSAFLVALLLLGSRALPPEQAHVANALIHVGFDVGVATVSVYQSTVVEMQAVPPQPPTR